MCGGDGLRPPHLRLGERVMERGLRLPHPSEHTMTLRGREKWRGTEGGDGVRMMMGRGERLRPPHLILGERLRMPYVDGSAWMMIGGCMQGPLRRGGE